MTGVELRRVASLVTSAGVHALPYIGLEHVVPHTGRLVEDYDATKVAPSSGVAAASPGDVLFGKLRPYLSKSTVVQQPALVTTELLCIRPATLVDSRWLGYVVLSRPFVAWAVASSDGAKMPRSSWAALGTFVLPEVSLAEQRVIADFLDAETARIDALIETSRSLVEVATARAEAAISRAIWSPPYRPVSVKYLCGTPSSGNRDHTSLVALEDGVPCLRGFNVRPGTIDRRNLLALPPAEHVLQRSTHLKAGDLVVVRSGLAGSAAVVPKGLDGCNCIDLVIVRRSRRIRSTYLQFCLNSREVRDQTARRSSGALLRHLNAGEVGALKVPERSLQEQEAVEPLCQRAHDAQCGAEEATEQLVSLLRERRQALITAAVTGQMAIPGMPSS